MRYNNTSRKAMGGESLPACKSCHIVKGECTCPKMFPAQNRTLTCCSAGSVRVKHCAVWPFARGTATIDMYYSMYTHHS